MIFTTPSSPSTRTARSAAATRSARGTRPGPRTGTWTSAPSRHRRALLGMQAALHRWQVAHVQVVGLTRHPEKNSFGLLKLGVFFRRNSLLSLSSTIISNTLRSTRGFAPGATRSSRRRTRICGAAGRAGRSRGHAAFRCGSPLPSTM